MPVSSRNEIAGKHRDQRRENSPYSQRGRKDKMAASRGWKPSIWKALTFWKSEPSTSSDEDSDSLEDIPEQKPGEGGKDADIKEGSAEDSNDASSSSAMNSSTVSEDQVLRQLIPPTLRQVRFQLPHTSSLDSRRISPPQPGSFSYRPQPYVAPLPPSGTLSKTGSSHKDPMTKVSEYLNTVILPRGGECTDVEALGLNMLIQSSIKTDNGRGAFARPSPNGFHLGSASRTSTPSRDTSPNRNPFIFSTQDYPTPLKPTFTTPNTDFSSIFSRPDSPNTATTPKPSSSSSSSRPLARNPNGNFSFQGGGSAKTRYRSPAFGNSSPRKRVTFPRDFGETKSESALDSVSSPSDGKRRRVGEETFSSIAQSSGPSLSLSLNAESQSKEGANGNILSNGHGTLHDASGAQSSAEAPPPSTSLRFGTAAARFSSSTPVRPSPLRHSMRADSSSPGSPNSNQSSPDIKTNGNPVNPGHAKAVAIFADIVSSASKTKDEQASSLTPDFANPYDTRPPTKRTRRPTKPARPPPPRPTRRTVSGEATPPPPESPRKSTALEIIEKSAPVSVQNKRIHAEINGQLEGPKQPSQVEQEVIEIDDEEPVRKKVKAGKPERKESPKEAVEIIDVDSDVDMNGPVSDSTTTTSVLRPSEVVEPTEPERTSPSKPALARVLYPSSLSKGPGRFGNAPKEPSPLRNSFQPESESESSSSISTNAVAPKPDQSKSKANPFALYNSTSTSTTTTTVKPAFSSSSTTDESSTTASTAPAPKFSFGSTISTSASSEAKSGFSFGQTSSLSTPFTFPAPKAETTFGESKTWNAPSSGFTFGQTSVTSSSFATTLLSTSKPISFDKSSSLSTPAISTPEVSQTPAAVNDVEAIKKTVSALKETELPTFKFSAPVVMNGILSQSADRAAVVMLSESSLPVFTFDTKIVPKSSFDKRREPASASVPPPPAPKSEVKGFDWSAAGIKVPVSSGWTCTVCCVPNKDTDAKCVCCGENKP